MSGTLPALTVEVDHQRYRLLARPPLPTAHYDIYRLEDAIHLGRVFISGDLTEAAAIAAIAPIVRQRRPLR